MPPAETGRCTGLKRELRRRESYEKPSDVKRKRGTSRFDGLRASRRPAAGSDARQRPGQRLLGCPQGLLSSTMALLALRDVSLGFHGPLVLDQANLILEPGERICLLGRNGTGKTTLLRLIQGEIEPPQGEIARQQGLVTAMLPQEVPRGLSGTVFDEVARGLGPRPNCWPNITIWPHGSERSTNSAGHQHRLEIDGGWQMHRVERLRMTSSRRRVPLFGRHETPRAAGQGPGRSPDILLLDEPTNHLDIDAIGWLEDFLLAIRPARFCSSRTTARSSARWPRGSSSSTAAG